MRIICIRLSEFFSSEPTQIWDPRLLRLARDVPKSGLQLAPSSTIFEPSLNAGIFLKKRGLKSWNNVHADRYYEPQHPDHAKKICYHFDHLVYLPDADAIDRFLFFVVVAVVLLVTYDIILHHQVKASVYQKYKQANSEV